MAPTQKYAIYGSSPDEVTGAELAAGAVAEEHLAAAVRLRTVEPFMEVLAASSATSGRGMVLGSGDEEKVEAQDVPDMTVKVALAGTSYNHLGQRIVGAVAPAIAIDAADQALDRRDIVVNLPTGAKAVRKGTPAQPPADPELTAGDVPLARVTVAAGVTAIEADAIADLRARKALTGARLADRTVPGDALEDGAVGDRQLSGAFAATATPQTVGAVTADVAAVGFGQGNPTSISMGVRCTVVGTTAAGETCAIELFAALKRAQDGTVTRIGLTEVLAAVKDAALTDAAADLVAGEGPLAGSAVVRATGVADKTITWRVSGRAKAGAW